MPKPLPRYQCHKHVEAFRIGSVQVSPRGQATLFPQDISLPTVDVDLVKYVLKHSPEAGGYYVRYEDGYESYSPADAFESGYTRIEE